MNIEYDNSPEDVLYLNMYHYQHSPAFRLRRLAAQFAFPLFLLAVALALLATDRASIISISPIMIVAVVWVFFAPRLIQGRITRQVKKLYERGEIESTLCRHKLFVKREGIVDRTQFGEARTPWPEVRGIITTQQHIFIYISPVLALIIPRRAFSDDSKRQEFVAAVKLHCERAQ